MPPGASAEQVFSEPGKVQGKEELPHGFIRWCDTVGGWRGRQETAGSRAGLCPASWPGTDGRQSQGFPQPLLHVCARPKAEGVARPAPAPSQRQEMEVGTAHTAWKGHRDSAHTLLGSQWPVETGQLGWQRDKSTCPQRVTRVRFLRRNSHRHEGQKAPLEQSRGVSLRGASVAGAELGERKKGDPGRQSLHPHVPVTP